MLCKTIIFLLCGTAVYFDDRVFSKLGDLAVPAFGTDRGWRSGDCV